MKKKTFLRKIGPGIALIAFLVIVFVIVMWSGNITTKVTSREAEAQENAIRKAAVTCYAIEGRYPESLDYIKKNYGIVVNEEDFVIKYDVFASNIIPGIEVKVKGE